MTFGDYSAFYDLLNAGKDYAAESAFVTSRIRHFTPHATTMLELGSGTGSHAAFLAPQGFTITGIERSAGMADAARAKSIAGMRVITGDIRDDIPAGPFDCAIALFHVISYLTANSDLQAVFAGVASALRPGGVFAFDTWFTPAVYAQGVEKRTRTFENERLSLTRRAEPTMEIATNTVEVTFIIDATDKSSGTRTAFTEKHLMRHFSQPEIALLAEQAGLALVAAEQFLTGKPLDTSTWGSLFILQKPA